MTSVENFYGSDSDYSTESDLESEYESSSDYDSDESSESSSSESEEEPIEGLVGGDMKPLTTSLPFPKLPFQPGSILPSMSLVQTENLNKVVPLPPSLSTAPRLITSPSTVAFPPLPFVVPLPPSLSTAPRLITSPSAVAFPPLPLPPPGSPSVVPLPPSLSTAPRLVTSPSVIPLPPSLSTAFRPLPPPGSPSIVPLPPSLSTAPRLVTSPSIPARSISKELSPLGVNPPILGYDSLYIKFPQGKPTVTLVVVPSNIPASTTIDLKKTITVYIYAYDSARKLYEELAKLGYTLGQWNIVHPLSRYDSAFSQNLSLDGDVRDLEVFPMWLLMKK